MTVHELQRRLSRFNISREVEDVILSTQDDITDLNKRQLFSGIRSTGTEIKPSYAPLTILIKDQKGQPTDRVTLKDTGQFYESFFVDVNSKTFDIGATDSKSESLVKKYGNRIFGLTPESRGEYIAFTFFPELQNRIVSKLGIKFS